MMLRCSTVSAHYLLGLIRQSGFRVFYRVIYSVNTTYHAETLRASFGRRVFGRAEASIPYVPR
jgi:hypothetical protein